jgi:ProP effector
MAPYSGPSRNDSAPVVIRRKLRRPAVQTTSTAKSPPPPRPSGVAPRKPRAASPSPTAQPTLPAETDSATPRPSYKERQRLAARNIRQEMKKRWPQIFDVSGEEIKPLKVGIQRDIAEQFPGTARYIIWQAIAQWQREHQEMYLKALAAGGPRYNLDGQICGDVDAKHQAQAQTQLADREAAAQPAPQTTT